MNFIRKFVQKIALLKSTEMLGEKSFIIFDKSVDAILKKGASIRVEQGVFKLGGALPQAIELPSHHKTKIIMEENSKLIIQGDVYIGTGSFIHVKENSTLTFAGRNYIGHNNIIVCSKELYIGRNSSTSWNVTLIDHDGHTLYDSDGRPLKIPKRPLIIGENVGLQMNVTIPRGISVGKNSLVGANTVLRKDVSEDTYIYFKTELTEKHGFSAGLQFFT